MQLIETFESRVAAMEGRPDDFVVLTIDDDRGDSELIRRTLKGIAGVDAVVARRDAEAALSDLAGGQVKPSLILLDLRMPRVNGFAFVERLRSIRKLGRVPVVALTTSAMGADWEKARVLGFDDYVVKPTFFQGWCEELGRIVAGVRALDRKATAN